MLAGQNADIYSSVLVIPSRAPNATITTVQTAKAVLSGSRKEAFRQVTRFAEGLRTGHGHFVYAELRALSRTPEGRKQLLEIHLAVSELIPVAKSGERASILINLQEITGALARGGR